MKTGIALLFCAALITITTGTIGSARTFTVTTVADAGGGSLRQAILDANATSGRDTILFDILVKGPLATGTISPASPLPIITGPVLIDATGSRFRTIELSGANAGSAADGLSITAGGCAVRGLTINRFGGAGIRLSTAGGNVIEGNIIGANVAATSPLGNRIGVYIDRVGSNIIGGEMPGSRNVISGNTGNGVEIFGLKGTGNQVKGNYIGTNGSGTGAMGNGSGVVIIDAPGNFIGGGTVAARNVISGNRGAGIIITADGSSFGPATGNSVQGNFVGVDVGGTVPIGNGRGIVIGGAASNNSIGGSSPNVVSGNASAGVVIDGHLSFAAAAGNSLTGNVITLNGGEGVLVKGMASHNALRRNAIYANGGNGIDLAADGMTPNDPLDADRGPNELQNAPELTLATIGEEFLIQGRLCSRPNAYYEIEFYRNRRVDSAANGEGEIYLGSITVLTDAQGNAELTLRLPATDGIDGAVTATATDGQGNTSEFSSAITVRPAERAAGADDATTGSTTGSTAGSTTLMGNYPNPFFASTTVRFVLAHPEHVVIEVFTISGQRVVTIVEGAHASGLHQAAWDGRDEQGMSVAEGVYLCVMRSGGAVRATTITRAR